MVDRKVTGGQAEVYALLLLGDMYKPFGRFPQCSHPPGMTHLDFRPCRFTALKANVPLVAAKGPSVCRLTLVVEGQAFRLAGFNQRASALTFRGDSVSFCSVPKNAGVPCHRKTSHAKHSKPKRKKNKASQGPGPVRQVHEVQRFGRGPRFGPRGLKRGCGPAEVWADVREEGRGRSWT